MTRPIRRFQAGDADRLAELFFQAVHEGAAHAYTAEERAAWVPRPPRGPEWEARLSQSITLVDDGPCGPLGFMTLTHAGMLDLAFVRPDARGCGVATALYNAIEAEAAGLGLSHLSTEASHPARRFFLKQGWVLLAEQQVERNGIPLTNFRMEKRLT